MATFAPKGERAEWCALYDLFRETPHGTTVTYEAIAGVLGRDLREHRGPLDRAMKELERHDHRTLEAVRGVGYRVVTPGEHLRLGRHHEFKSRRQLQRGLRRTRSADRAALTDVEARRLDSFEERIQRLEGMMRAMARRQDETTTRVEQLELAREEQDSVIARAVEAKLREHGLLD